MEILIVDDSNFMLNVLKNVLKNLKIDEIYTANDGDEAVETYKDNRPDLVLLDIVMDNVDGIEALEQIKDFDEEAKVLMISAVGQQETVKEALEKGAEGFIKKPFENQKVQEKIKEVSDL
jgi:two-component system chemotaxis response regulator CheY